MSVHSTVVLLHADILNTEEDQYRDDVQGFPVDCKDLQAMVDLVNEVRKAGCPNVYGARIPLKTHWNLQLMEHLAEFSSDREVTQFTKYGQSLNHDGTPITISMFNHTSAERHAQVMNVYIEKEHGLGCLLGPFVTPLWSTQVAVFPMSTRPKKNSTKR